MIGNAKPLSMQFFSVTPSAAAVAGHPLITAGEKILSAPGKGLTYIFPNISPVLANVTGRGEAEVWQYAKRKGYTFSFNVADDDDTSWLAAAAGTDGEWYMVQNVGNEAQLSARPDATSDAGKVSYAGHYLFGDIVPIELNNMTAGFTVNIQGTGALTIATIS